MRFLFFNKKAKIHIKNHVNDNWLNGLIVPRFVYAYDNMHGKKNNGFVN